MVVLGDTKVNNDPSSFEFRTKARIPTSKALEKARFATFGDTTEPWWPYQSASHGCNAKKVCM